MDRRPERGGHRVRLFAGQDSFPERGIALGGVGLLDLSNRRSGVLANHPRGFGEGVRFVGSFNVQCVLEADSIQHELLGEGIDGGRGRPLRVCRGD